jgi:hypothetical protein
MLETHEYKGMWWLAADPEKKLAGTLAVSKGSAELEVLGHLGPGLTPKEDGSIVFDFSEPDIPSRVIGQSATKEDITLEAAPISRFPADISTYDPPWVLVGKAFTADDEIAFDEMIVELSDLDAWTRVSGFTIPRPHPELPEEHLSGLFDIEFKRPTPIEIQLEGGDHASIEFSVGHSGWKPVPTSLTVSQRASVRLRFAERHSLNAVARRIGQLRNFFCLAVGRPVSVLSVTAYQDDYRRPDGNQPLPIKLLWEIPHNAEPPTDARHPTQMAFTLRECPNGISEVMKAWLAMQEQFAPVFNLFFGMRYHPDVFGELRFLAYSQALESYDRRRRKTGSAIDQRLRATLKHCPTVRSNLLKAAGVELDEFLASFADSRNYYTHYTAGPHVNSQATRGALLLVLTIQLQAIIEMVLLHRLGFSNKAIDQIFATRLERYRQIANVKAQASDEDLVVPQE